MPDGVAEYVRLPIYQDQLCRALSFTPSDLQENRAGRLSASQRSTQLGAVTRSAIKSAVLVLFAVGGVALFAAIGVTTLLGLIPMVLAALFLAWVGIFAWYMPPVWRDVDAGIVSSLEGLVTPAERRRSVTAGNMEVPIWSYYWVVDGGQRFWVPGQVYPVLTPARHRLYFLPSSRRIVAAEPIS
jgi:hypothetical protein